MFFSLQMGGTSCLSSLAIGTSLSVGLVGSTRCSLMDPEVAELQLNRLPVLLTDSGLFVSVLLASFPVSEEVSELARFCFDGDFVRVAESLVFLRFLRPS